MRVELRYDLRHPAWSSVSLADRYEAALDQIEWGERHGIRAVTLSEHHGTDDSYLPSALTFAAAVAARTHTVTIRVAALVAALHDPLRVAEDAAVVDQLSRGRLELVVANGYVDAELAMFGRARGDRVPAVEETVRTLKDAWTGQPFEFRGRTVRVTPRPSREPRPPIYVGGASEGAARRAARIADAFFPTDATHWDAYRRAVVDAGGGDLGPMPPVGPRFLHVAEDVDAAWEVLEPHVRHDREAYGTWAEDAGLDTGHRRVDPDGGVRDDPEYLVMTPEDCVEHLRSLGPGLTVPLHPMMGGIAPEVAWPSLRLFMDRVAPEL